jgi:probable F420-dependent oxidoreductase
MKIGAVFPQTEIAADPGVIKDYVQALEELGFEHIIAYDHVLGVDTKHRPDWKENYYRVDSPFQEPLTLFSFLSGLTERINFVSGILILPQRQTALVAKQAACVDVLSGGRLRLGVGIGWNQAEYQALGMEFAGRGARLDEQIELLKELWSQRSVNFSGRFHLLEDVGINPLPVQRPVPIWVGGVSSAAMERAAAQAEGWLPTLPAAQAREAVDQFRERVSAHFRNPEHVGIHSIVFSGRTEQSAPRCWEDVARDLRGLERRWRDMCGHRHDECGPWLPGGAPNLSGEHQKFDLIVHCSDPLPPGLRNIGADGAGRGAGSA